MRPARVKPLLLVAHGSRDPRAAATTRALAGVVNAARPGLDVWVSFLEHALPGPAAVLRSLAGSATVVPLLLTKAYHGRVDLPAQVCGFDVTVAEPLGQPGGHLLDGLVERLHAAVGRDAYDGLVLAAAGTRVAEARATVEATAAALGTRLGVPAQVAYAAGTSPTGADAVEMLRARGAPRVAVAAYFLACGQLYDNVMASARAAGAVAVAEPLGASEELARLILERYDVSCAADAPARRATPAATADAAPPRISA
jgi:sirohydrochlorin ferrochelatase